MSWVEPTSFEKYLVADVRERWPAIIPLAELLSLATRIEPRLLRNARLHFIPGSATEIESLLWFSPLVGARSSDEIVLHPGAARLLANRLRGDPARCDEVIALTGEHTRHWSAEDRLEQDLRLHALLADRDKLRQGLQDMLKRIHDEADEERRIRLARWTRRSLATIAGAKNPLEESRLLAQYASQSLGTTTGWSDDTAPQALPDWLNDKLPAPYQPARLAVELRYDPALQQMVLHCLTADPEQAAIDFPTPLPANLHVQCEGHTGSWQVVGVATRVPLPVTTTRVLLTTIAGRRYELLTELPAAGRPATADRPAQLLFLSHLADDREQARRIADWLGAQGIRVELIEEDGSAAPLAATTAAAEAQGEPQRLLRLWTRAAQRYWAERSDQDALPGQRAVLLRTDAAIEPPPAGQGAERLLDLPDWQQAEPSAQAVRFLEQIRSWLTDNRSLEPSEPTEPAASTATAAAAEVERLLAEIEDPMTTPPRRLAIGDRLAEIGDPRPGVGVREYARAQPPSAEATPAEARQLVDELARIETLPPRRLAIGDRLAELGDPRPGVGLDSRGLPALDWVEIPGGTYLYQQGETRSLPTFHMARYPITNVQYQAFIDAGGYDDQRWWADLKQPRPEASRWPQPNRPRTNVDWYEATAFSRWLSAQLGYEVRLPSEEEWERAARGRDGRTYPWGERYESGYANVDEKTVKAGEWYLEQTTAVGVYPQGASSEGVLDLGGNVWEFCESLRTRGGSWSSSPDGVRVTRHYDYGGYGPDYRVNAFGFRLVSSAPIAAATSA